METASTFCFSQLIWNFSSWETWNLSYEGTFFFLLISSGSVVVNIFSQEILNGFFWANIFSQVISRVILRVISRVISKTFLSGPI